jgi:hypothetical protein
MNIEALVNGANTGGSEWVSRVPQFEKIYYNLFLGRQLETEACSDKVSDLYDQSGVYLHWALPDGLTHGTTADDGSEPEFPLIPNRWLIVRFWDQAGPNPELDLKFKAWIMESDTITDDTDAVVWPNLRSQNPDPKNEADYYVYVGRQFKLDAWPGETAAPGVDITAVGYGETAFAAYYPACRGILGFHDNDLAGLPDDMTLTYFVAGWYSDPSKDPLAKGLTKKTIGCLAEILEERKWTYPEFSQAQETAKKTEEVADRIKEANEMLVRLGAAHDNFDDQRPVFANTQAIKDDLKQGAAGLQKKIVDLENEHQTLSLQLEAIQKDLPGRILCHGILDGIRWQGESHLYDSGVPRGKPIAVAAGNTAVEALCALFKGQLNPELVRLLEVFQYDLLTDLEKPGGRALVDQKIHERTFKPLTRGIHWDLIHDIPSGPTTSKADQTPPPPAEKSGGQTPPIPGEIRLLLENLNQRQREINRLRRERASIQSELYATWYKKVLNAGEDAAREDVLNQRLTDLQQEIASLATQIAVLEDARDKRPLGAAWDQIQQKLSSFLPEYKLQRLDEPRFWHPNDPVVLLAGQAFQRTSRHGEDGRFRNDGRLLCRLSGQEISSLKITLPNAKKEAVEFGPPDLDQWCQPFPEGVKPAMPGEVENLFRESLFLTLAAKGAEAIAAAAYEKNEPVLAKDRPQDVKQLAADLIGKYLKKVWQDARDPDHDDASGLKYQDGQTVWEFDGKFPSPVVISKWEKNPWLPLFLQWQVSWIPAYDDASGALQSWELTDRGTAFTWQGQDPGGQERKFIYSDTTLLTSSAALNFSDRLRRYNLSHANQKLKDLQTAVSRMNLLCQSLGGFTENLLMRKAFMELQPLDPGKDSDGPQFSPIFEAVRDIDWLSPLVDQEFFPVRAGHLKLEKLWIIDAFGQLLRLEAEPQGEKVSRPLLPAGLAGSNGYLRLEPRLDQPARLSVAWPAAGRWDASADQNGALGEEEEFNPVCGWILPNFLDRGLMIYDVRGNALGALQAVQRKSWEQGVGAKFEDIESFHWVDIPGRESFFFGRPPKQIADPLGEKANPHLRAFVKGLLSLSEGSGQAFGQLLDNMNEAFSAVQGSGSGQNPNLALLIGKPLALVRAALSLELDGRLARAQGWADINTGRTGGIEKLTVPIRLGDRRKWDDVRPGGGAKAGYYLGEDGLVGFFLNRKYDHFYPAFGLEGRNDNYSEYRMTPGISIAQPLDLTLLMDPSRGFCATSGILPRKIFNLPYGDITETLENKQIVFFTGPLVSEADAADKVRMPQPSDIYGQWSWTHHPALKVWREATIADSQKEQGRFFDNPLQITEGWLKLITAPLEIRVFKVKGLEPVNPAKENDEPNEMNGQAEPERFEISGSRAVILTWAVIGAEAIELEAGGKSLFKSGRHPLPTQYRVQVDQDATFTLTATGRAQNSGAVEEQPVETKTKTIEIVVVSRK